MRCEELDTQGQADKVEEAEHCHPRSKRFHTSIEEAVFLPGVLVEPEEHGEGNDEVDPVERRAKGPRHEAVLEAVIGEGADSERLHEGRGICQENDEAALEDVPGQPGLVHGLHPAQHHVGEDVVGHEVREGQQVHGDGHVVQPMAVHRVVGLEHAVEVVGVPVAANEAEDENPGVGLHDVPLGPRLASVALGGECQGVNDEGGGLQDREPEVLPAHEVLIQL
mmetsp:Transcript_30702/g.86031  ORF Transcript_30702/g.86031 Transcript_30702/m.86031 type:complete len:223 (-) Transcript_30702:264-932(-)